MTMVRLAQGPGRPEIGVCEPSDEMVFLSSRGSCVNRTDGVNFFPDKGQLNEHRRAVEVCMDCPVRVECLTYAIVHVERFGIWGGTGGKERGKLIRIAKRDGIKVAVLGFFKSADAKRGS